MSKRRLVRGLTSAVLTGAMILSMGGMTAFAESTTHSQLESYEISLTKVVDAEENVLAPNTSFTFKIELPTAGVNNVVDTFKNSDDETIVVYKGEPGGAYFETDKGTVTFTPGDELSKSDVKITLDDSVFSKPGVYRYVVTEVVPEDDDKYNGMTYGKDTDGDETYYLDLYVENGANQGDYIITAVKAFKNGTEIADKAENIEFTNKYTTNNLTVTKVIDGNQADFGETFKFSITVNGADGEKFKTSDDTIILEANTEYSNIELGHNETITIYGLSSTDTFTVVETDAGKDGYTTTYALNDIETDAVTEVSEGTTDQAVVVTNKKDVATPTGIALSFAPYALLVALAGAFAALFLGKKKRDEF